MTDINGELDGRRYVILTEKDDFFSCSKSTSLLKNLPDDSCKNYRILLKKQYGESLPFYYKQNMSDFTRETHAGQTSGFGFFEHQYANAF